MKTKNKALLLTLCAVLLVAASVLGTMAYLTSRDAVENTFSVGSISLSLDEQDIDNDSNTSDNKDYNGTTRDKANAYKLLPGHTYVKDPIIHITTGSEDAWVFVKVENGIADYEAETVSGGYTSIAEQITITYGWTALTGVDGVYYKEWHPTDSTDLQVFANFKVADNANETEGWADIESSNKKINVTGYAVQMDGFEAEVSEGATEPTAAQKSAAALAAWNATFGTQQTD